MWTPKPGFPPLIPPKKIVGSCQFRMMLALDVYISTYVYNALAPDVSAVENLKGVSQVKNACF